MKLKKEEKQILESYEKGEWKKLKTDKSVYAAYAEATVKKDKRINIRISKRDLVGIQKIAIEEGLPYQTLISSVIHKFVSHKKLKKETA